MQATYLLSVVVFSCGVLGVQCLEERVLGINYIIICIRCQPRDKLNISTSNSHRDRSTSGISAFPLSGLSSHILLTPSLHQPEKFPGLKSANTRLQKQTFPVLRRPKSTLNAMRFEINLLVLYINEKQNRKAFKTLSNFRAFIGRF